MFIGKILRQVQLIFKKCTDGIYIVSRKYVAAPAQVDLFSLCMAPLLWK